MSEKTACAKCGAPLEAGARFCGACGTQQPGAVIPHAAARPIAKTVFQGSGGGAPAVAPSASELGLAQTIAPASRPTPAPAPAKPAPAATPAPATAPAATPADLTGQVLNGRYAIEAKIGEGGFGAVYRARQTQMGREVALKVLHAKMAKDPQVIGRFQREAQASSKLRAAHTVQVYDFDQSPDGVMYLAMELLTGKSLHLTLHQEKRLPPGRAARILDGVADSLEEAHGHGIVHRDIKPENIYLEPRPSPDFVKVLDFGIAKIVSGEGTSSGPALTAAGQTLGTLEYMSPEQLMGQPLDGRSDLYALGVLAYEMLTGQLPFPGKTPGELITGHLKTVPKPPSQAAPDAGIPPIFDQIVLKLLEKQRDQRYPSARELRRDLERVIVGESAGPTLNRQPQAPVLEAVRVREESGTERVQTHAKEPESRKPATATLVLLLIAVVAVLAGGALFWLTR